MTDIDLDDTDAALMRLLFETIETKEQDAARIQQEINELQAEYFRTEGAIESLKRVVNDHSARFAAKYNIPLEGVRWTVNKDGVIRVTKTGEMRD